jgi:cytochrome P450
LSEIFNDIVHIVILGESEPEKIPTIFGYTFSYAIEKWLAELFMIMKNPLHTLTLSYSTKWNMTKKAKKCNALYDEVVRQTELFIKKREKMEPKETINLIDLMVQHNKKCDAPGGDKSKKVTLKQMIGNSIFFYGAGTDTSRATSTSLLYCLSKYKQEREEIMKEIEEVLLPGTIEDYIKNPEAKLNWDDSEKMDQFLNETMRLWGIANVAIYRTCTKNHKLGNINIKKGTRVSWGVNSMHRDERYFPDPEKFDTNRFSKENKKKMLNKTFMPFYGGTRECSGKYLGEIMTKCGMLSLLSCFEVEECPEFDPKWIHTFTLEMPSVKIRVRPRQFK